MWLLDASNVLSLDLNAHYTMCAGAYFSVFMQYFDNKLTPKQKSNIHP